MRAMAERLAASDARTIVVLTPHGAYVEGALSVALGASAAGEIDGVTVSAPLASDFSVAWCYEAAAIGVPVAPIGVSGNDSPFPLDWGVTIPLALLTQNAGDVQIAVGCPARDLTREQRVDIGTSILAAADDQRERVALIVSADQGHGHAADGRYGFSAASAKYDASMCAAIRENDLERLLTWDEGWIDDAMPDSYWQTLSLIAVQRKLGWRTELLAYEVDHYFGLICAELRPDEQCR